jgi:kynureninase
LTIQARVKRIRQKSQAQTQFLVELINLKLHPYGFEIETPSNSNERGSHITLKHKESWRICKALIVGKAAGVKVIPDFRPPDYLRLGVAPIYTSYLDLFLSIERIEQIMQTREYEDISSEMPTVT